MNSKQNKILNGLLTATGNNANKAALVSSFTNGRSESRKDLTENEAETFITWLNSQSQVKPYSVKDDAVNRMRRKIIAIAHHMGWKLKNGKADMARINTWCMDQFGKKQLNEYTEKELSKLVSIFDKVYSQFLKNV